MMNTSFFYSLTTLNLILIHKSEIFTESDETVGSHGSELTFTYFSKSD